MSAREVGEDLREQERAYADRANLYPDFLEAKKKTRPMAGL